MALHKERLAAINQHVNIGRWIIVFPLRFPVFPAFYDEHILIYIRENYSAGGKHGCLQTPS